MLTSTILLIEDEQNLRQSLQLIVQLAGYTVTTLQNIQDTPLTPESTDYQLIILSLQHSGNREIEQIAKIRALFPNTPLLILAANDISGLKYACQDNQIVILAKPVDPKVILASIREIVSSHP